MVVPLVCTQVLDKQVQRFLKFPFGIAKRPPGQMLGISFNNDTRGLLGISPNGLGGGSGVPARTGPTWRTHASQHQKAKTHCGSSMPCYVKFLTGRKHFVQRQMAVHLRPAVLQFWAILGHHLGTPVDQHQKPAESHTAQLKHHSQDTKTTPDSHFCWLTSLSCWSSSCVHSLLMRMQA